jgi:hypothetical protein
MPTPDPEQGEAYVALAIEMITSELRRVGTSAAGSVAIVVVRVEPDGRISSCRSEVPLDFPGWDALLATVTAAVRLPPPPAGVRERYRTTGLVLLLRP